MKAAIVMPIGPGKESALDTLASVEVFCPENDAIILIDDHTKDGTYEALTQAAKPHWHVVRNDRPTGVERLVHGLCFGFRRVIERTDCDLVLRLDQDALIIKPGILAEAADFVRRNPKVGLFGVYDVDYNRPRSFEGHRKMIDRETAWWRGLMGVRPSWAGLLNAAERNGYKRGDNVFGGAYFVTRECLVAINKLGALDVPWSWNSRMMEDVYFSMAAVAAGFQLGHFAAPRGPMCMEWRGLPFPAAELASSHYKLIHSVDKGKNTGPQDNGGKTAREFFRDLRANYSLSKRAVVSDTQRA